MTIEEIKAMEAEGIAFERYGNKRIIAEATQCGYTIQFLEDGAEIIRAPDGQFLSEWPKGV